MRVVLHQDELLTATARGLLIKTAVVVKNMSQIHWILKKELGDIDNIFYLNINKEGEVCGELTSRPRS